MIRFFLVLIPWLYSFLYAQDNPRGEFYRKDQVKGFLAFKADYRQLSDKALANVNGVLFRNPFGFNAIGLNEFGELDTGYVLDPRQRAYNQFGNGILGMNAELGAQYHQFLTWIDVSFMPTQISPKPGAMPSEYRDVEWFRYGFDWMFGWMIAPPDQRINVIPSLGFGVSLQNFSFATDYDLPYGVWEEISDQIGGKIIRNRFYSRFGKVAHAQVELRLNLGIGISVGGYAGARLIRYDRLELEQSPDVVYWPNSPYFQEEANGDEWFLGLKVTYTMESPWEKRLREEK